MRTKWADGFRPVSGADLGAGHHHRPAMIQPMEAHPDGDPAALRGEVERLRAENEKWRRLFRVEATSSAERGTPREVRVLLLPDPLTLADRDGPGPEAAAGVARTAVSILGERFPEVNWRTEYDLKRVPTGATCHQLGDVSSTLWGRGGVPMTFVLERDDGGQPRLQRRLVHGEPASDRFAAAYDRQLEVVDELLAEGEVAWRAGAKHHATWALKAADVVLARLAVSLTAFQVGAEDWKEGLGAARPEYEPRYRVQAGLPTGY